MIPRFINTTHIQTPPESKTQRMASESLPDDYLNHTDVYNIELVESIVNSSNPLHSINEEEEIEEIEEVNLDSKIYDLHDVDLNVVTETAHNNDNLILHDKGPIISITPQHTNFSPWNKKYSSADNEEHSRESLNNYSIYEDKPLEFDYMMSDFNNASTNPMYIESAGTLEMTVSNNEEIGKKEPGASKCSSFLTKLFVIVNQYYVIIIVVFMFVTVITVVPTVIVTQSNQLVNSGATISAFSSYFPSSQPSSQPSGKPTDQITIYPSNLLTFNPTTLLPSKHVQNISNSPSLFPTSVLPSRKTAQPTYFPTSFQPFVGYSSLQPTIYSNATSFPSNLPSSENSTVTPTFSEISIQPTSLSTQLDPTGESQYCSATRIFINNIYIRCAQF